MLVNKILAGAILVPALVLGISSWSSADSISDAEADALIGGACPYKTLHVNCSVLTMTVTNEDGTTSEVNCPASPFNIRIMLPSQNGDIDKGAFMPGTTCMGCGEFYKRVPCTVVVDPPVVGGS